MNIELLKRLRTRFARMRHPNHFRMAQVAIATDCGAAMCFIGHSLVLAGYKMKRRSQGPEYRDAARSDYDFIRPNGETVYDPADEAQFVLGLDYDQTRRMFQAYHLKTPKDAVAFLDRMIKRAVTEQKAEVENDDE